MRHMSYDGDGRAPRECNLDIHKADNGQSARISALTLVAPEWSHNVRHSPLRKCATKRHTLRSMCSKRHCHFVIQPRFARGSQSSSKWPSFDIAVSCRVTSIILPSNFSSSYLLLSNKRWTEFDSFGPVDFHCLTLITTSDPRFQWFLLICRRIVVWVLVPRLYQKLNLLSAWPSTLDAGIRRFLG